ncbi:hypothetical protein LEAN103870_18920 [Legionella anisa]|uniref:Peptidase C39-like domain-containing protein n=3 Tax=Legionella anisa TaxID=28082 RepID=A0AAX0WSB1_9GAMM|nr:hypothetical protein [Legionella anisa]AWN74588.1 hypothetical protein DLD14_12460 [Legionella anisa]KTC71600.1 hypothetical protein Lani_1742 [Legionella anisa]MCW8425298.1 hypothetical protein [Legionella anisa]MCW8449273.1 hypothetical protein [Legionella anisa]PNL61517.1 hypothetical protein A6J39_010005 [Legionella anisa]
MEAKLLEKLKKINPLNQHGVPKSQGNCHWCAIEAARVLLQDVEPREIPEFEGGNDPVEGLVHSVHGSEEVEDLDEFFQKIQALNRGELMLVRLENTSKSEEDKDLDHSYLIYVDENNEAYLIDPDRQIFVELEDREDFYQSVKGWKNINTINYLNGELDSAFTDNVKVCICKLTREAVHESSGEPLPEYGTEVPGLRFS